MNISNNKILITGGGSGIGRGLTEALLKENNTVIICGRRKEVLDELAAQYSSVITFCCDLEKEEERINLYEWVAKEHDDLNVLINNAGIQQWMHPDDEDFFERAKTEVAINILAPVHLNTLFIKLKSLHTIINVTSALGFCPLIKVPVYSGTKAFFHSYTLSLRKLMEKKNIEVIELIPPALNTDLGGKGLHDWAPPVSGFIASIMEQMKQGKQTLTYGLSETMSAAGPEQLQAAFDRMNGG